MQNLDGLYIFGNHEMLQNNHIMFSLIMVVLYMHNGLEMKKCYFKFN